MPVIRPINARNSPSRISPSNRSPGNVGDHRFPRHLAALVARVSAFKRRKLCNQFLAKLRIEKLVNRYVAEWLRGAELTCQVFNVIAHIAVEKGEHPSV
jgi:hypothetical protein